MPEPPTTRRRQALRLLALGTSGAGLVRTAPVPAAAQGTPAGERLPLRIALPHNPTTLDPHRAGTGVDRLLAGLLWEPLFRFGSAPHPVPAAAAGAQAEPGAERWLFSLRPDLRWPSGAPLTAGDFVRGWRRLLERSTPPEVFAPFRPIRGAGAFRAGILEAAAVGLQAPDPFRVVVSLEGPGAHFADVAALAVAVPWLDVEGGAGDGGWVAGGNGPYALTGRSPGRLDLSPSLVHRSPGAVPLTLLTGAEPGAALTDLSAPEPAIAGALADVVPVPDALAPAALGDPRLTPRLLRQVRPATLWLNLNVAREPLDSATVRKALAYAVDREAFAAGAVEGAAIPAYSLLPPGCPGHDPAAGTAYRTQPATALTLLGAAGVQPERLASLSLTVPATSAGRRAGTVLLDGLERSLGVRPGLVEVDRYAYVRVLEQRRFDLALGGWESPYPDPEGWFWLPFGTGKAENRTGWESPAVDALWRAADETLDSVARLDLYRAAQGIVLEEAPVVFLAHPLRLAAVHPRVAGLGAAVMDDVPGAASLPGARLLA